MKIRFLFINLVIATLIASLVVIVPVAQAKQTSVGDKMYAKYDTSNVKLELETVDGVQTYTKMEDIRNALIKKIAINDFSTDFTVSEGLKNQEKIILINFYHNLIRDFVTGVQIDKDDIVVDHRLVELVETYDAKQMFAQIQAMIDQMFGMSASGMDPFTAGLLAGAAGYYVVTHIGGWCKSIAAWWEKRQEQKKQKEKEEEEEEEEETEDIYHKPWLGEDIFVNINQAFENVLLNKGSMSVVYTEILDFMISNFSDQDFEAMATEFNTNSSVQVTGNELKSSFTNIKSYIENAAPDSQINQVFQAQTKMVQGLVN